MSRGDESFPRYTYMMDFNPDEDTPLRDYWHTADDLDNEDAATIASLATQALQSKSYGYGDGQVSESLAANYLYSESRSSPQSQYSTTMQAEPAESFRGLMEDHDRGARLAEVNAISDYDFGHEARGHVSDEVAGMEEPSALSREQHGHEEERYAHDPFRPLLSEPAAEVETAAAENLSHTYQVEMSAAMTASRVVNGVLRRSYASTPIEMDVDPQSLQPQAPRPTSPQSESSPVSVPTPEVVEPEQEVTIADDEQHVDDEPETAPIMEDEKGTDEGEEEGLEHGNEDPREEVDERRDDGGQEAVLRVEEIDQAEEVRGQEAGTLEEVGVEDDDAQTREDQRQEETQEAQRDETWEAQRDEEARSEAGVQQQLIEESNERPTINDSEDLPPPPQQAPRKRGRPRKSDAPPAPPEFRAEQLQAAEVAVHNEASFVREVMETAATDSADLSRAEELPTERKRGRPRKSEGSEPAPAPRPRSASAKRRPGRPPKTTIETTLEATQTTTVYTGKRGRPRKSSMAGGTQALAVETSTAAPPASGKRGRPRKSEVVETSVQASTTEVEVSETGEAGAGVSVPGKRGRPRKSEAISTDGAQLPIVEPAAASAARAPSRRGRPRKSETTDDAHASTSEAQPSTVEAAAVESAPPTAPSGKRGRPRKSEAMPVDEVRVPAVEGATVDVGSATSAARSSSKRGRPRKRDASSTREAHLHELETTTVGTAAPAARSSSRRGRPRKSDTLGDAQASAVDSQPHPVETAAVGAATPTARSFSRRGRPRKSGTLAVAQASIDEFQLSADDTTVEATTPAARSSSKRGRPRKRHTLDITQVSTGKNQLLADEFTARAALPAARSLSRRGRPRKSDATSESTKVSTDESQLPVVDTATSAARSSSRRGRPRKSDATDTTHVSINEAQLPVAGAVIGKIADTTAPTPRKRGRPRKSSFVGANTQAFTAEPHPPAVEAPDIATPTSNKRGRPRKIDGMGDTQVQLSTAEASTTTTPALGKRGRPRSASVASSTTTPGRRGQPPKNTVPLSPAEIEALSSDEPTTTAVSTFSIPLGQPIRAFLQADEAEVAEEEEAAPPSPLSVKKRGRGRPPKSPALFPVNVPGSAPEADHVRDIWEFDPQSPIHRNTMRKLTADETASRRSEEVAEGTPVRKRGRRKSVVADQPLPAIDVSVTSPTKKRGRPPKATAAIHLAETDGPSVAVEELQDEEGPMTKRIRADNDTTMDDAVDEDDPQRQTLEDGVASVPSVSERTETTAPSHTIHQQSASTSMKPRIPGSTGESSAVSDFSKPFSRPDGRPRIAEESTTTTQMLDKGTQTRAVEKPSVEPPRSIFELLAGARRTNKVQKTYGKRFKRL
ncbi:hypothetical protein J3F83DRAFT_719747 [Trichoderma novae-zelandiae]